MSSAYAAHTRKIYRPQSPLCGGQSTRVDFRFGLSAVKRQLQSLDMHATTCLFSSYSTAFQRFLFCDESGFEYGPSEVRPVGCTSEVVNTLKGPS